MAEKFDPYYKWLGIPPKDQPPHHYRLLGIELFEPDRDVIDAAANRLMGYLKELAAGDDASHSQKLLNEISRARLCLLNKEKKAAYDQELRKKLKSEEDRLNPTSPEAPPPPQVAPSLHPPAAEPPAFMVPPKVAEPPRIEIGAIAAQLDTRNKPPPLKSRGVPAAGIRENQNRTDEHPVGDQAEPPLESRHSKKRWLPVAAIGLTAIGITAVMIAVLALSPSSDAPRAHVPRINNAIKESGPRPVLVLVLTEEERKEITEFLLDDQPQPLPPGAELTLEPGRHRLILRRTGYEEVFDSITLVRGVHREYRPRWRREVASMAPPPPGAASAVRSEPLPKVALESVPESPEAAKTAEMPPETAVEMPASATAPSVAETPQPPLETPEPLPSSPISMDAESRATALNGFTSGFGQLVAHWPFDADTGDRTGRRHDGITIGEANYVEGRADRALQFVPGLWFEVGAPLFSEGSEFATCLWLNLSSLPAGDGKLISGVKTVIFVRGGSPCVEINGHKPLPGPNTDESTGGFRGVDLAASLNSWVHLGMTYSARLRQLHFYLNGEHRGCQHYPEAAPATWERTIITGVSATLDDLRVFDYRLGHADFKAIFDGNFQPPPAPPRLPDGKLVRETWYDIAPATSRDEIATTLGKKPDQTNTIEESLSTLAPVGTGDCLDRIQGFLYPPENGDYSLELEGSGQATLYLQRSEPAADTLQEILATQPGQTAASPRTAFQAGKPCYFEILHFYKTDSAGTLRLGWRPPGSPDRLEAIPAAHFGSFGGVP
jgi:hypothetical protein